MLQAESDVRQRLTTKFEDMSPEERPRQQRAPPSPGGWREPPHAAPPRGAPPGMPPGGGHVPPGYPGYYPPQQFMYPPQQYMYPGYMMQPQMMQGKNVCLIKGVLGYLGYVIEQQ